MDSSEGGFDENDKEEVDGKSKIDSDKTFIQKIFGGKKPDTTIIIPTQKVLKVKLTIFYPYYYLLQESEIF